MKKFGAQVSALLVIALLGMVRVAGAQVTFEVVHPFTGSPGDGANPSGPLIQATDGNFYGMTLFGGSLGVGTIYRVQPDGTETVLHSFISAPGDGANPAGALTQATDGNFYGATQLGGAAGLGTIYQMTPDGTVTILHNFTHDDGAAVPAGTLIQASDGNLYGTSIYTDHDDRTGYFTGGGTVFQITLDGTLTILHHFAGGADGYGPNGGLVQASDGNFYGTTHYTGGNDMGQFFGGGTLYQMTLDGTVTTLHEFAGGTDGYQPLAGLVIATDGTFYGTTSAGGMPNQGTVFQITSDGTIAILHTFAGGAEGAQPFTGLIQATDGNFYGTTQQAGALNGGTVFRITPDGTVTTLHDFDSEAEGAGPRTLIQALDGNFYGATFGQSGRNLGSVFRLSLQP
jgi:uncharacterized repeat protein (TIGR03803 family)